MSGSFGFEYRACRAERTLFKMCGTASSGQNKKKNLRCPHKGAKEAILPEHLIQLNCVRRWMMTKHIKRDNLLVQESFAAGILLRMATVGGWGNMASQVLWKRMTHEPKNSFAAALAPCPCFFGISRWPEAMNHSGHRMQTTWRTWTRNTSQFSSIL